MERRYACHWLDSCNGQHELCDCEHWKNEFRHTGMKSYYYSRDGTVRHFDRTNGHINHRVHNPKACLRLHLLVYTIRPNGETHILFGLAPGGRTNHVYIERPMLSLVYSMAFKRSQEFTPIAQRAFEWITDRTDIFQDGLKSRFVFQHSNVVYPLYVTSENADILVKNFKAGHDYRSVHWFPLTTVLERLTDWSNDPVNIATIKKLTEEQFIEPQGFHLGEYEVWSVTAACLMYIQKHFPGGYYTFL